MEAPQSGLRMLGSLLKQLGKRELAPLRRQQMEWVYGLTGKAGSAMYMVRARVDRRVTNDVRA